MRPITCSDTSLLGPLTRDKAFLGLLPAWFTNFTAHLPGAVEHVVVGHNLDPWESGPRTAPFVPVSTPTPTDHNGQAWFVRCSSEPGSHASTVFPLCKA